MKPRKCRFCNHPLNHTFTNLGMSPLANSFVSEENLNESERFFPLHVFVCRECLLVQIEEFEKPHNIFSDYAYFSSYSNTWLKHAKDYVNMISSRFSFNTNHYVIEIASNDGYLLQFFKEKKISILGIEPAHNIAKVAQENGIPTLVKFFGEETAIELTGVGKQADLLIGNNVLAHVPNLNDFIKGMKILLKPTGIITMEFPHLLQLMKYVQFDTIYHEHFSYFSFHTVQKIFAFHGLNIFDVEEIPTHGGSLRIYATHVENVSMTSTQNVNILLQKEKMFGLEDIETYIEFSGKVTAAKRNLLEFLIEAKRTFSQIVCYGAAAKGNTLLNYCGIGSDFIDYVVDRSPHKQGLFLPGSHLPVFSPDKIRQTKPDYLLILPWNLKDEIISQMSYIREWGGKFVIPIPEVKIF